MQICKFYQENFDFIETFEGPWNWKIENEQIAENS
jgi:hypothetical protein